MMTSTRDTLIDRLRSGHDLLDWQQFDALYRPFLRRAVLRWGLDEATTDDCVQEILIAVVRALDDFEYSRERGRFRGWLKTIAQRTVIDHFRRISRRHEVPLSEEHLADIAGADEHWDQEHHTMVLQNALESAEQASRPLTWRCFQEHYLLRRPAGVVGSELGLSATAVYSNASRTLQRVRRHCAQFDEELAETER